MNKTELRKFAKTIPTYIPKKANELPMFFENKPYQGASGKLYPIPYADGITDEKTDVEYEAYSLENEYVKTELLPQIGGKVLRGYDKIGKYDFIYYNEVVKPALVGLAGPWISGGIEFNWPQHHRPTTFLPLESEIEESDNGSKTVWMGEVEPLGRMKAMVGITLDPGRSYIKARVKIYNRTDRPRPFMWWANLAVPVNDDYRTVFPPDCEWVNDHDRRAVLQWPIAKGVYNTARPYDFGDGTDISRYSAIKVPSSYLISQGQSDMDFISGYDEGKQKGIATVADHHISPGKKMWHWGKGDFGDMWCSNLTDNNGPYIELMTGVYTDNQPDFTWIAPYESREFEQFWYPIRDIGCIKNATIDAAVNLEQTGENVRVGFNVTGVFKNAVITVSDGKKLNFTQKTELTPSAAYIKEISLDGACVSDVTATLTAEDGKVLVSYKPYVRGNKKPIDVRKPVKRPCEIESVEELYINGYHLEQYKQHNYDPRDYYLEGLSRDPGDIRCNTSMARLCFADGKFDDCISYCDKAIERLTMRNQHPTDTESFYLKGLALMYGGKEKESYDELFRAGWNYTHRSAAYYNLALLDCRNGDFSAAKEKLKVSLGLNSGHSLAADMLTAVMRKTGDIDARLNAGENLHNDPLDFFAIVEASHYCDLTDKIAQFAKKPENLLDVAAEYIKAGMFDDAVYVIGLANSDYPLYNYYKAYCLNKLGMDYRQELCAAEKQNTGYCFPSRVDDIQVLRFAIDNKSGANALYYLGCLYFDRGRYDEAADCFEQCVAVDNGHYKAYRNLALIYFDKRKDAAAAKHCMEAALSCGNDPRVLFEYQQLLKNMNSSVDTRIAVYKKYPELFVMRDDCYLDYIVLLSLKGDYKTAIETAAVKRFHIYEGGEGKLTKQHAWMHVLYALEFIKNGKLDEAEKTLKNGIIVPKSYGEAKTFFNQEAHIYYYLGEIFEQLGEKNKATEAFESAAVYKAAVSEISVFRAAALQKLGRFDEAHKVLSEMEKRADELIKNKDLRSYYGVGSPSPMPFENDIEKQNLLDGFVLKAYALAGLGNKSKAQEYIGKAALLDMNDFRVYAFKSIKL